MSRTLQPVSRWAVYTTWLLSLVGLGLAIYLTVAHFEGSQILACSDTGLVNCAKVTTSAQSYFLGIPVAVLGLANFVIFSVINSPWAWKTSHYWVHVARIALSIAGMIFVLWLVYAELIIINNICLYCTGVHIVTFAMFVVLMRVVPDQLGWGRSTAQ
ncbi:MAG: vitamin K epoxide reductase family protein [Actinomycetota bacterium]|nr:vitamin K epoxide reductase family protein [Actinomycetota bacterium]